MTVLTIVRDVAIIALALESIVLGVLAGVLMVRLLAFIDVAQAKLDEMAGTAGDVLESAREAAQAANQAAIKVRGSTSFMSDRMVLPAIRVAAAVSGAARFAQVLVRTEGRPRRGDRGKAG